MLSGTLLLDFAFKNLSFLRGKSLNIHKTFLILDSPSTSVFLEELNKAVKPLQDYGISVAKVEGYLC